MPNLSFLGWRIVTFKLNFAKTIWWWQLACRNGWMPTSITKFGWDVNIKYIIPLVPQCAKYTISFASFLNLRKAKVLNFFSLSWIFTISNFLTGPMKVRLIEYVLSLKSYIYLCIYLYINQVYMYIYINMYSFLICK